MSNKTALRNISFEESLAMVEKLAAQDIITNRTNSGYTKDQLKYLEDHSITYLRPSSNLKRVVDYTLPPIVIEYRRRSMKKDKKKLKALTLALKADGLTATEIEAKIAEADAAGRLVPDDSVSFQRQHMENVRLAKQDGIDLESNVLVFEEEGSAFNRKYRPEFEKMIKFISSFEGANPIYLYVYEISRMARNKDVWNATVSILSKQSVTLRSVLEPFIQINDPSTDMVASIMSSMAEASSRQTSERMIGSQELRAKEGVVRGAGCPVGLKIVKMQTKIGLRNYFAKDEEPRLDYPNQQSASWLVGQIFDRYNKGDSATAICQWLNDSGFPTTNANLWAENTIMRMLRNPHYAGYIRYNPKTVSGARLPLKMVKEQIVKDDLGNFKVFFEGVVTPELFWEVQSMIEGKHKPRAKQRTVHKLSGIVTCSRCGSQMFGNATAGHPRTYRCPQSFRSSKEARQANNNAGCVPNNIRGEALDTILYEFTRKILSNKGKLKNHTKVADNNINMDDFERQAILDEIKEYEALFNGETRPALKTGYKVALEDATERLAKLNNRNVVNYHTNDTDLCTPAEFDEMWNSGNKIAIQMVIKALITAIEVHPVNPDDRMNLTAMKKNGWIADLRRITLTLSTGEKINLAENDAKSK